jgi:hypothetical protein
VMEGFHFAALFVWSKEPNCDVHSSNSCAISSLTPHSFPLDGPVVQWLERAAHNGVVVGSNPARPTIFSMG